MHGEKKAVVVTVKKGLTGGARHEEGEEFFEEKTGFKKERAESDF